MRFIRVSQQLHTLKAEILALGGSPLIVGFDEQRTHQADYRGLVWGNPNNLRSASYVHRDPIFRDLFTKIQSAEPAQIFHNLQIPNC